MPDLEPGHFQEFCVNYAEEEIVPRKSCRIRTEVSYLPVKLAGTENEPSVWGPSTLCGKRKRKLVL